MPSCFADSHKNKSSHWSTHMINTLQLVNHGIVIVLFCTSHRCKKKLLHNFMIYQIMCNFMACEFCNHSKQNFLQILDLQINSFMRETTELTNLGIILPPIMAFFNR